MRPRGRLAILLLGVAALVAGIAGGLLRAGVAMPLGGDLPRSAAAFHATLMISGFFGTVIGIERAVAVRERAAFAAPLASGLGAMLTLAGLARAGAALGVLAALAFVLVTMSSAKPASRCRFRCRRLEEPHRQAARAEALTGPRRSLRTARRAGRRAGRAHARP